jgi:hypothetical protein
MAEIMYEDMDKEKIMEAIIEVFEELENCPSEWHMELAVFENGYTEKGDLHIGSNSWSEWRNYEPVAVITIKGFNYKERILECDENFTEEVSEIVDNCPDEDCDFCNKCANCQAAHDKLLAEYIKAYERAHNIGEMAEAYADAIIGGYYDSDFHIYQYVEEFTW